MRILTVMNLYPPHSYGGYEDLCAGAVSAWRRAGEDVHVLASTWRRADVPADAPPPGGEPVRRELPMYWDGTRVFTPPWRVIVAGERRARRAVSQALDEFRPDILSVWNAGGVSFSLFDLARQRGVPVVLVILDRWLEFGPQADPWRARFEQTPTWADRLAAGLFSLPTSTDRLGDPVMACFASSHLQEHAHRATPWTFDDEAVVPHGVDRTRYPSPPDHDQAWHGRLLYVGRLVPEKGVETAIRAVSRLPGTTLDVVGTGPTNHVQRLRELVAELGVDSRVHFRGEAGPRGLQRAYVDADAVVFPSQWPEPFGVVPLEAMSSGTPVLATGTGGSGEFLVDGVTCLRFAPRDADGLARAIARLGDEPRLRRELQATGLQVAGWLDRERANRELLDWHRYAANELTGPRPTERGVLPPGMSPPRRDGPHAGEEPPSPR